MPGKDQGGRVVAIGGDHAGYGLKQALKAELEDMGYSVLDMGTDSGAACDYPDIGRRVAEAVSLGEAAGGVLICGTGVGMGMVANKVPGVRAAVCNEVSSARFSRLHNNANVLTMGARIIDAGAAKDILKTFFETEYEGDSEEGVRHRRRLQKLSGIERDYMKAGREN